MRKIKLTQGKHALVDDENFDWLNQWKWYFNKGYAVRKQHFCKDGKCRGKGCRNIMMHRIILGDPKGILVKVQTDHINGGTLDNRRKNLRIVTHAQNMLNRKLHKNNKSGYRGICWDKNTESWRVYSQINKKWRHWGYFKNKVDAVAFHERNVSCLFEF